MRSTTVCVRLYVFPEDYSPAFSSSHHVLSVPLHHYPRLEGSYCCCFSCHFLNILSFIGADWKWVIFRCSNSFSPSIMRTIMWYKMMWHDMIWHDISWHLLTSHHMKLELECGRGKNTSGKHITQHNTTYVNHHTAPRRQVNGSINQIINPWISQPINHEIVETIYQSVR